MRRHIVPLAAALLAACGADTVSPPVIDHLEIVLGGSQVGTPGRTLDSLIVLRLVDDQGGPVIGARLTWSVSAGAGTIEPLADTTGLNGLVAARWTLGMDAEAQELTVTTSTLPGFHVTATAAAFRATSIALGDGFGCGLDSLGDAWCWGTVFPYSTSAKQFGTVPVKVDSGHALVQIVAGGYHACARSSVTTYCWGAGVHTGQGLEGSSSEYTPSGPVVGGHQFTELSAGYYATCGLEASGQGWCWGGDVDGSLGSLASWNTLAPTPAPIDQSGQLFSHLSLGYDHSCALDATGAAWCWGRDRAGKLGDSTNTNGSVLHAIRVTTDLRFTEVSVGDDTSCGTTSAPAVWCWGADNFSGTFSTGTTPRRVDGGGYGSVVMDYQKWVGLRRGRVYFWGSFSINDFPLPGFFQRTPHEVPGDAVGTLQLAMSPHTLCALRVDGVVLCWGSVPGLAEQSFGDPPRGPVAIPAP